ncbi:MAG: DUF935 family protein [Candidatus Competibacter sp.]|nr:DUF935 family protein [Candidatus Competibacter sp.]MDS4059834.1 DUF935 family protein [Candidatus Contendobacter sp.]
MFDWLRPKTARRPPSASPLPSGEGPGVRENTAAFAAPPERREIAGTDNGRDWTRGWIGPDGRLLPQDEIWREQSYRNRFGYDLYRDLLTDWAVFAALQNRRRAVVCAETEVVPGGDRRADRNAAAFVEEQLQHVGWDAVTEWMHYGIYYGFAVAECLWGRDGSTVTLDAVRPRDRRRFVFDGENRLRLLAGLNIGTGELLPERKFWVFGAGADHGDDPYGMGLAHWLYWPVIFKRGGIKFWLIAAEKFGSPTAAGWFPPGTPVEDQDKLLAVLGKIQTDAGLILPDGIKVELLEAKRAAGGDYAELCTYMDQAISRIALSQLAQTESTASRLNVGAEEPDSWRRLIKGDADLICDSFNRQVVAWLCDWNFPGAAPPQVWRRTDPGDDLAQRSEIERRIFDLGYRPTLKQIEVEYDGEWEAVPRAPANDPANDPASGGVPLPSPLGRGVGGEGTAPPEAAARPAADAPAPAFASPLPSGEGPGAREDPTAPLVERLGREADPLIGALLAPVRELLARSADLSEFRAGLLDLYPDLDPKPFAALMAQALAVADAAGRFEAQP